MSYSDNNKALATYDELNEAARKLVRDMARDMMRQFPTMGWAGALELTFSLLALALGANRPGRRND